MLHMRLVIAAAAALALCGCVVAPARSLLRTRPILRLWLRPRVCRRTDGGCGRRMGRLAPALVAPNLNNNSVEDLDIAFNARRDRHARLNSLSTNSRTTAPMTATIIELIKPPPMAIPRAPAR